MIPLEEEIRDFYDKKDLEDLDVGRKVISRLENVEDQHLAGRKYLRKLWPDELEYISKTMFIQHKEDHRLVLLEPNYGQRRFYQDVVMASRERSVPIRAMILKARQIGFSTFILAWQFHQCEENTNRNSMTISYDDWSTKELLQKTTIFQRKQMFPIPLGRKSVGTLQFRDPHLSCCYSMTAGNRSAGRSVTIHHMHFSEVPMWENPEEVSIAAAQCVPNLPGSSLFKESTAKGAMGLFYDDWNAAQAGESDYIPFFAPWTWDPNYKMDFPSGDHRNRFGRSLPIVDQRYRERHNLSLEQMNWRRWKIRNDLNGSERLFRQEFPITSEEAFLTSGSPVFNADRIHELQENCTMPLWVGDIFFRKAQDEVPV